MKRNEIDNKYKWSVDEIYQNEEIYNNDIEKIKNITNEILNYKNLLLNQDKCISCLKLYEDALRTIEKLYVYLRMKSDEDLKVEIYQNKLLKLEFLITEFSQNSSFILPELTSLEKDIILKYSTLKELEDFSYYFKKIIDNKEHILTNEEEQLLSGLNLFISDFDKAFSILNDAELDFGKLNINGKNIKLTHGNYIVFLQDKNENTRKKAYIKFNKQYKKYIQTISTIYQGHVKSDFYFAKVRKYESSLQKAVKEEDVNENVYKSLINAVNKNICLLHNYCDFRAKLLNKKKLEMWDFHVPLYNSANLEIEYEEAKKLVIKALEPMGKEYINILTSAFESGWIDVYENDNKRSGAYSFGSYDTKPYVLLNYYKTCHDIFTIAHELGHSMHSYYSRKNQPYMKAQYEIFVAEIASTVNEVLLLKYLLKATNDKELKKYLLSYYLDMFRTTLYRQTQFAEFESITHNIVENGDALTSEKLNDEYYNLNKKYYGENVVYNELSQYEWARIPHFYSSFYVYKYATGISSAINIALRILNKEENALENYIKFLSLGGSMSPLEILNVAGVDLEKESTFEIVFKEFKDTLDKLKKLEENNEN